MNEKGRVNKKEERESAVASERGRIGRETDMRGEGRGREK